MPKAGEWAAIMRSRFPMGRPSCSIDDLNCAYFSATAEAQGKIINEAKKFLHYERRRLAPALIGLPGGYIP